MTIRVLAPEVAAKIAAGEVVERPASAVKELVENAIDAGATRIAIEIQGGGEKLIRVTDNGCGIPAAEIELAFHRHATSKIQRADDLARVGTLGFRGEALPSIVAVAQVSMVSRAAGEPAGAFIALEGGVVTGRGRRAWASGTAVTVRNLFYNAPARRKHLKAPATEASHIIRLVSQFALAYPQLSLRLACDGQLVLELPGSGRLCDVLSTLYGLTTARQMLEIFEHQAAPIAVYGYVSPPNISRANRSHNAFFVNGRCVHSRALLHAVDQAYRRVLPQGRYPIAILNLRLPPEEVDVNVHPAKAEVRFFRERLVYAAVQRAVRQALEASATIPTLAPPLPAPEPSPGPSPTPLPLEVEVVSLGMGASRKPAAEGQEGALSTPGRRLPVLRILGQAGGMFIVAEGPEGIYLIDQHRAHERVLYERLVRERAASGIAVQALLEPITVEVTPYQAAAFSDARRAELASLGFHLEPFGERTYLVRAVPAVLAGSDLRAALAEVIDLSLAEEQTEAEWQERLFAALACRSAVKAGQTLSPGEMRELIIQLEGTALPLRCPHGAPVLAHLSQAQLEKEFMRR